MEVRAGKFVPCCHGWLTSEYHDLPAGEDVWNGPAALELRRRILNGDYSLCRRDLCHVPIVTLTENDEHEAQVSSENAQAIENNQSYMPGPPQFICVVADPRCNLDCPSCRKDFIFEINDDDQKEMTATEHYLRTYSKDLLGLRFAGDGEVFFSAWKRQVLKSISRESYPKLQYIELTTNGVLFDQKNFDLLRPGTELIRRITVSIDAGTKDIYSEVRGKDWDRLMQNLVWMSGLKKSGQLKKFQINFTIRAANYRSIPQFVKLGEFLDVSSIKFMAFEPWHRMKISNYQNEAVHLESHPEHAQFYDIWSSVKNHPKLQWALPVPKQIQTFEVCP